MFLNKFLEQDSLTFESYEDAAAVQKILIENGYCTMMSREEHLWLLNWVWTEKFADRNGVIFVNRAEYEYNEHEWFRKHPEYVGEED
jgi:hypothetical protein